MKGMYTDQEFRRMYERATAKGNYTTGRAWTKNGHTINYYHQHTDGSWTNYDCKTKY